jgi:hypothetical protein
VAEIFLPVDKPDEEANIKQLAEKLTREMLQGKAPFPRVATQFSQSASAKRGGDIGWVQEGSLYPEIEDVLMRMNEGDLSEPVRTISGYYIVTLRKKRVIAEENIPSREEVLYRLGTERLERRSAVTLLDLKAEAFIRTACLIILLPRPLPPIDALPPLREVIAAHELRATKALGQNFLLDMNITDKIARQAGDMSRHTVIEIGPGPGGLTRSLLKAGAGNVIAIEFDARAVAALQSLVDAAQGRLQVESR